MTDRGRNYRVAGDTPKETQPQHTAKLFTELGSPGGKWCGAPDLRLEFWWAARDSNPEPWD